MPEPDYLYQRYLAVARGFDHEATVVGHRVTWAVLFSGGLVAATAVLVNAALGVAETGREAYGQLSLILLLALVIALLGLGFSVVTLRGVFASHRQAEYLRGEYSALMEVEGMAARKLPRPFGDPNDHLRGNEVARTFPIVMMLAWAAAAVAEGSALFHFYRLWFP